MERHRAAPGLTSDLSAVCGKEDNPNQAGGFNNRHGVILAQGPVDAVESVPEDRRGRRCAGRSDY